MTRKIYVSDLHIEAAFCFAFLNLNILNRYSKEPSKRDGSLRYLYDMRAYRKLKSVNLDLCIMKNTLKKRGGNSDQSYKTYKFSVYPITDNETTNW